MLAGFSLGLLEPRTKFVEITIENFRPRTVELYTHRNYSSVQACKRAPVLPDGCLASPRAWWEHGMLPAQGDICQSHTEVATQRLSEVLLLLSLHLPELPRGFKWGLHSGFHSHGEFIVEGPQNERNVLLKWFSRTPYTVFMAIMLLPPLLFGAACTYVLVIVWRGWANQVLVDVVLTNHQIRQLWIQSLRILGDTRQSGKPTNRNAKKHVITLQDLRLAPFKWRFSKKAPFLKCEYPFHPPARMMLMTMALALGPSTFVDSCFPPAPIHKSCSDWTATVAKRVFVHSFKDSAMALFMFIVLIVIAPIAIHVDILWMFAEVRRAHFWGTQGSRVMLWDPRFGGVSSAIGLSKYLYFDPVVATSMLIYFMVYSGIIMLWLLTLAVIKQQKPTQVHQANQRYASSGEGWLRGLDAGSGYQVGELVDIRALELPQQTRHKIGYVTSATRGEVVIAPHEVAKTPKSLVEIVTGAPSAHLKYSHKDFREGDCVAAKIVNGKILAELARYCRELEDRKAVGNLSLAGGHSLLGCISGNRVRVQDENNQEYEARLNDVWFRAHVVSVEESTNCIDLNFFQANDSGRQPIEEGEHSHRTPSHLKKTAKETRLFENGF
jgi:hypothetical protein